MFWPPKAGSPGLANVQGVLVGVDPDDELRTVDQALSKLTSILDRLPDAVAAEVRAKISHLLTMLEDRRHPRVMMVGRRGAGKSQMTNALFSSPVRETGAYRAQTGKAEWEICEISGRQVEILDTRGVQEGSTPAEEDPEKTAEESLLAAIQIKCPDVILFLVKATEVDAAITGDLSALELVHREAMRVHETAVRIIPVLTHCDALHPADIRFSPHDSEDAEKMGNVMGASRILTRHLKSSAYLSQYVSGGVVPTSALVFFEGSEVNPRRDYRWNIDRLALRMQEVLPDETQLSFVRLAQFRVVQKRTARSVVATTAVASGVIGLQPIPFADYPFITGLQVLMIIVIAYIAGREISLSSARQLLTGLGVNIGVGLGFREVARALVKLLPAAGNAASGAIAAAGTKAIGEAAVAYFIDKQPLSVARERFESGG
ncbi:50S ribosome-binding GTPase [Streptomyces sp. NEAU-H22]|uniref:GTPase n=1 Tax=Streptomyces sp. NEAU-H22 TaxID=2994655 RepID=UPI00224DDCFD|nr:GTPase [Streptomyces sp. NEAU-H22]MCX3286233.1 50S ribosome-binding GTPase [Streptomyces sp. NEAU-H22]